MCARNFNMKWNNEMSLQLIEAYEKYPILWDTKHEDHFSRSKKADAWDAIALDFEVDAFELKQKMNSLRGSFRRERAKGKKRIGKGRHEMYISKWFAFDHMGYLLDNDEPRTTMDTDKRIKNDDDDLETVNNINSDGESVDIQSATENKQSPIRLQPIDSPVPPKKKQKKNMPDPRREEAYHIVEESLHKNLPDSFSVYGQHIANKLRSYSKNTQTEVEHAINNILYTADKGAYDRPTPQHS